MSEYLKAYKRSLEVPEAYWSDAAKDIDWNKTFTKVLDDKNPPFYKWFPDGKLNTCFNALDRHVENGHASQIALIYDSPVTDTIKRFSYRELRDLTANFSGVLREQGVRKGDTVIIYMPMVPEAVIAMLACARLGAVHSVVFGGFASNELATRINDAQPKVIVSASCGIEVNRVIEYKPLLDAAIATASHKPKTCIILQRPQCKVNLIAGRDVDWQEASTMAEAVDCVPVDATDPLYILYTSGTTGRPKGVLRDNGGHAVALNWSMKNIYNMNHGDVFWSASDVGWVVGHSYIVYAPLLCGCTTVLYEGKPVGTPDAGAFWRVIEQHKVNALFTAPTAFRAIKGNDPDGDFIKDYDLSSLQTLFLAGERCDPATIEWAEDKLGVPVIDHWWQTETGWAITANCMGLEQLPVKHGSTSRPVPGYNLQVLDEKGISLPAGEMGKIALKLPLPPGCLQSLWKNDQAYIDSYLSVYDGYYITWDAGYIDEDGDVWVMSRLGDVINVAGHRLSTGAMEEVLATHPDVAECAVIGVNDQLKGQLPIGLVVLNNGVTTDNDKIIKDLIARVRNDIGPVAAFKKVLVLKRLPKTRSGKILRGIMKKIADGETFNIPATIDDEAILDEIAVTFKNQIESLKEC
ncbi:MAG: propionyl-CoA synthetase [marine bacterium B5-7]|nr:MAG: propionyl-CoA synthetase [marine bacterium B5-7]